jgi:hypothetical protein
VHLGSFARTVVQSPAEDQGESCRISHLSPPCRRSDRTR